MLEVTNHSPEADDSYRHFALRVDPELRPMTGIDSFGAPQPATARMPLSRALVEQCRIRADDRNLTGMVYVRSGSLRSGQRMAPTPERGNAWATKRLRV
jgi:hypothetical protein